MRYIRPHKDNNKLYYYCSLSTALEFILPKHQLLLSPLIETNDPRENKSPLFTYNSNQRHGQIGMFELNEKYNKLIKEDCKVICFSQDYKNYQGCHLSKMWAHYGDNHKGICLEINKDKFIQENSQTIDETLFKKIIYTEYDFLRRKRQLNINLVKVESEGEENYIRNKFRIDNIDALFFTKNNEWESESETRLILFSNKILKEYCSIENSLEAVHLGVDFHNSYISAIRNLATNKYIYQMKFLHEGLVCTWDR